MKIIYYFVIVYVILVISIVFFLAWSILKGAPWSPTNKEKVFKILSLANVQPGELVYDLGCGDGRVLIIAAKHFGARAIGIEIDPIRFIWCKFLILLLGLRRKVQVFYGDFFKKDLSNADVVVCYLLQNTNDKLQSKLINELRPQVRVVSSRFVFSGLPLINMDKEMKVYSYNIGIQSIDSKNSYPFN